MNRFVRRCSTLSYFSSFFISHSPLLFPCGTCSIFFSFQLLLFLHLHLLGHLLHHYSHHQLSCTITFAFHHPHRDKHHLRQHHHRRLTNVNPHVILRVPKVCIFWGTANVAQPPRLRKAEANTPEWHCKEGARGRVQRAVRACEGSSPPDTRLQKTQVMMR